MTPTIRPFCLQDADRLATLWHASWRSTGAQASTQITASDLRQRVDQELAAGWDVFVAEAEGALVGFMALKRADHCLDQLFIAPHAKRFGIGTRLFSLAKTAMPNGFWLRTATDNIEAVGMTLDRIEPHPRHGHDTAVYVVGSAGVD